MCDIIIIDVRGLNPTDKLPNLIYCGRAHPAGWPQNPLANPVHLTHESQRQRAYLEYKHWLGQQIEQPKPNAAQLQLMRLAGYAGLHPLQHRVVFNELYLGCWCAPRLCHCQAIRQVIEYILISSRLLPEHAWMVRYDCPYPIARSARTAWIERGHTQRQSPLWDWVQSSNPTPPDLVAAALRWRHEIPL